MNLHKIAKVTHLDKLSKGRVLLIAAAVTWSTLSGTFGADSMAEAASLLPASEIDFTDSSDRTRLGGIPYKNRMGQIVVSGSKSDNDHMLIGCEPQAQRVYNRARASEPAITMDMLEIADDLGTSMDGLEYSVKTASSLMSKIERKTDKALRQGRLPKTDTQYVEETGDLIRYTQIVPHDEMAAKTQETVQRLQQKGYIVKKLDNKYLNKDGRYKAIHLDLANRQGVQFEMQIHSPETLQANRATHGLYEEWRDVHTAPERKAELYQEIKSIYDAVPQPKGIMHVKNFTRH